MWGTLAPREWVAAEVSTLPSSSLVAGTTVNDRHPSSPNVHQVTAGVSSAPAALAVTFLLLGLGYAFPVPLWPDAEGSLSVKSAGTLNLYAVTAWLGLAHFFFAVTAQSRSFSRRYGSRAVAGFVGLLLLLWIVSYSARAALGAVWFDGLVWVYFIAHFVKAEHFFDRISLGPRPGALADDALPVAAFALLSVALIGRGLFLDREVWLLGLALLLAGVATLPQGWRRLLDPRRSTSFVLAMFLIGEALVWGNYARFMSPTFADGVYGFHVAAASFYHYARAYAVPLQRRAADPWPGLRDILLVNLAFVVIGWGIGLREKAGPMHPVWDPSWFTVWVLWHLLTSDLARWIPRLAGGRDRRAAAADPDAGRGGHGAERQAGR